MDQKQWAVLFHALQNWKAAISLRSQIHPSAKVKQILFALSPDIELHLHQGGGKMMMTKYLRKILDQLLNHILDK